mmetsp:Transcript_13078/g.24060  ORF Transcript_13078/g.24060 Transcript_13078/m.24060 type:complete len:530 (-) Transcript_13078:133-1722(-)
MAGPPPPAAGPPAQGAPPPAAQPQPQPVQLSPEWWMQYAPSGHPYYINSVTKETTWVAPNLQQQAPPQHHAAPPPPAHYYGAYGMPPPHAGYGHPPSAYTMPAYEDRPEVTVKGSGHVPPAWMRFEEVRLPRNLIDPMLKAGFTSPTAIQSHAWPIISGGRDCIGIAKTGSGKTLGFLLPAFAQMLSEGMAGSPVMLVMAPTRELAVQIDADAHKFAGVAGITTALAYGGAPKGPQLGDLRRRPHLLTGTPGRLNDFLEARALSLRDVRFLVLDEADRMLDMGFEPQIRKVIAQVPSRRQTMMFTATWPKEIRRLASEFFIDPVEIRIGSTDELQANADIEQQIIICNDQREKEHHLTHILRTPPGQVIIFTGTKRMCDSLSRTLSRMGVRCEAIHGDRDQRERDQALNAFKSGSATILVATDVAARGLDVKSVRMVINFDAPNNAEDYIHRIGRTGRAGVRGWAITMLMGSDGRIAKQIADVMKRTGKAVPPELDRLASSASSRGDWGKGRGRRGGGGRSRSRSNRRH